MRGRIIRLQTGGGLQRRNRFSRFIHLNECAAETHKSVGKMRVEQRRAAEVFNSGWPIVRLPGDFPKTSFCAWIGRIETQFLFQFFLGFRESGVLFGLRQNEPRNTQVDTRHTRILLQHKSVLGGRLIPLSLRL